MSRMSYKSRELVEEKVQKSESDASDGDAEKGDPTEYRENEEAGQVDLNSFLGLYAFHSVLMNADARSSS